MRPKVVIGVLALAVVVIGLLALLSSGPIKRNVTEELPVETSTVPKATPQVQKQQYLAANLPQPLTGPLAVLNRMTNTASMATERIAELNLLAMNDDTNSLNEIIAELVNSDPAIRQAAREAVVQFGSRSAIPRLMELADQEDDPVEKSKLLEAVDFLSLPSLMDYRASPQASGIRTNRLRRSPFRRPSPPRSP